MKDLPRNGAKDRSPCSITETWWVVEKCKRRVWMSSFREKASQNFCADVNSWFRVSVINSVDSGSSVIGILGPV